MIFPTLLLLFTVVPAVEIALFIQVGGQLGTLNTFGVVIFTGIAGAGLARSQGFAILAQMQSSLSRGAMPTDELVEGAVVLFGGALLLTPGFLTDAFGLSCILPFTRKGYAYLLRSWSSKHITHVGPGRTNVRGFRMWSGGVHPGPQAQSGFRPPPTSSGRLHPESAQPQQPPSIKGVGYRPPPGPSGTNQTIEASFTVDESNKE